MGFVWFVLAFLFWALLHSVTAARPVKLWVRRQIGARAYAGFYRLVYNVVALISLLPVLYLLAVVVPATVLWRMPAPFSFLFFLIQGIGLVGLLVSVWQTDVWRFTGLRQLIRYLKGAPDPEPPAAFVRSGTYALVRHPLYFFSLLVIWFTPLMTFNTLLFNVLATVYFYAGAVHEEQRLLAAFGETYRRYRKEVPSFVPFWRWGVDD